MKNPPQTLIKPLIAHSDACIIATEQNNQPIIILRKKTNNPELIKIILTAAFYEKPILIQPRFTNRLQSINTLIQKGIIYREKDELRFMI